MPLVLRTLTNTGDPLCAPDGAVLAGVTVVFTLVSAGSHVPRDVWDAISNERVAGDPVSVTLDEAGEFSVDLWPNSRGNRPSLYLCHVDHEGVADFFASADEGVGALQWVDFMLAGVPALPQELTGLSAHLADPEGAHAAEAISVTPIAGRTATDAQAMMAEISADGGGTNLSAVLSATNILVTSDTGTDATLPPADGSNAGLMAPAQFTQLASVGTAALLASDVDGTLAANSDVRIATQKATKTYADTKETPANRDTSGGYAGLTLFKLNLRNAANTGTSFFSTAATAARTWAMPDKDGTVAMTSDITGTNSGTNTGDETEARIATLTHAASAKPALVDADEVTGGDSAAAFGLIRTTWTSVKAFLKTYFDTLYQTALVSGTNIKTVNSTSLLGSGNVAISASPGGSSGQPQWNSTGVFAGMSGVTWDDVNKKWTHAQGAITTSQPQLFTSTWNAGGVTFTGSRMNITDTASAAGSLLVDLQVGAVTKFRVTKEGDLFMAGNEIRSAAGSGEIHFNPQDITGRYTLNLDYQGKVILASGGLLGFGNSSTVASGGSLDVAWGRKQSKVMSLHDGFGTYPGTALLLGTMTVAQLPVAAAGLAGARATVNDAVLPVFLGTLAGGGSVVCPAFCTGVAWVAG